MDFGILGTLTLDAKFFTSLFSIVIIDLILAGDNAVVIAMAVRSLPKEQRKKGIILGAGAAVLLRVVATFFVAQLLTLNYVKLAGGAVILWIAVKLFVEGAPEDAHGKEAATIWQAVKIIVIADITMALDNMLAVGGASHGNFFLLLFGLALSIPFVVFTSNLLSMLMDKYPIIIYIGAAILGKVGGEMMITDPFTVKLLPAALLAPDLQGPAKTLQYSIEVFFAAGVIIAGKLWMRRKAKEEGKVLPAGLSIAAGSQNTPTAILTISRQYGSGGREIGRAVAQDLGLSYVDKESILSNIRANGAKWENWAKNLDEHCPTVWEKYDWSFRGFSSLVQSHILEHALHGNVVLMGRGANFLLKDVPFAYRVRIEAPMDVRVERIMNREKVDSDTARWLCEKTDHERQCFLHAVYGRRWDDPAEYDKVYQVSGQSVDNIVAEIKNALRERSRLATPESIEYLRLLTAAAKVKAGIATDPSIFIPVFDVIPSEGGIVIRGITHTPKEHKRIEDAARALAGNIPIRCELVYRK